MNQRFTRQFPTVSQFHNFRETVEEQEKSESADGRLAIHDLPSHYSGSPIAVHRRQDAEWLVPQEKATLHTTGQCT
jgi:hypothetical protein